VANWRIAWRVDLTNYGSCFGVYTDPSDTSAIIAHSELAISKLALDGTVLWRVDFGADIFVQPDGSESLTIRPGLIIAKEWNGIERRIDTVTGSLVVEKPGG
jgi:hypothetical protein